MSLSDNASLRASFRSFEIPVATIGETTYDISFFSCGYEERCTYLPSRIERSELKRVFTLVHNGEEIHEQQLNNEQFFRDEYSSRIIEMESDASTKLREVCRSIDVSESTNVLIDYSSMSKLWYNDILNWAEFAVEEAAENGLTGEINIDFYYSIGSYEDEYVPLTIGDISSLPGRDATHMSHKDSVALFGLGFDKTVVESVFDRLEPDKTFAFLASPGASELAVTKVKESNKGFIKSHVSEVVELPLTNVTRTASLLRELVLPFLREYNILLIPLGPKTHVLASILLCLQYPKNISCLRVKGNRSKAVNVKPNFQVIGTRVNLVPSEVE